MKSSLSVNFERLSSRNWICLARVSAGLAATGLESMGWDSCKISHVTLHHDWSMALTFHSSKVWGPTSCKVSSSWALFIFFLKVLNLQSQSAITSKTIDSPSIRQLSWRELSWLGTGVSSIVVGAEWKLGMGRGFFMDVMAVIEASSREEAMQLFQRDEYP